MREMAAIEALKSEKADKEVSLSFLWSLRLEFSMMTVRLFVARITTTHGHLGSLGTPEAACV